MKITLQLSTSNIFMKEFVNFCKFPLLKTKKYLIKWKWSKKKLEKMDNNKNDCLSCLKIILNN